MDDMEDPQILEDAQYEQEAGLSCEWAFDVGWTSGWHLEVSGVVPNNYYKSKRLNDAWKRGFAQGFKMAKDDKSRLLVSWVKEGF
jgi:hypothetical protein